MKNFNFYYWLRKYDCSNKYGVEDIYNVITQEKDDRVRTEIIVECLKQWSEGIYREIRKVIEQNNNTTGGIGFIVMQSNFSYINTFAKFYANDYSPTKNLKAFIEKYLSRYHGVVNLYDARHALEHNWWSCDGVVFCEKNNNQKIENLEEREGLVYIVPQIMLEDIKVAVSDYIVHVNDDTSLSNRFIDVLKKHYVAKKEK